MHHISQSLPASDNRAKTESNNNQLYQIQPTVHQLYYKKTNEQRYIDFFLNKHPTLPSYPAAHCLIPNVISQTSVFTCRHHATQREFIKEKPLKPYYQSVFTGEELRNQTDLPVLMSLYRIFGYRRFGTATDLVLSTVIRDLGLRVRSEARNRIKKSIKRLCDATIFFSCDGNLIEIKLLQREGATFTIPVTSCILFSSGYCCPVWDDWLFLSPLARAVYAYIDFTGKPYPIGFKLLAERAGIKSVDRGTMYPELKKLQDLSMIKAFSTEDDMLIVIK